MASEEPTAHHDVPSSRSTTQDTVPDTATPPGGAGEPPRSRRALLKGMAAAGALLPLAGKLSAQECPPVAEFGLQLDDHTIRVAASIIDRVATDGEFHEAVRAKPVEALEQMGVVLSPEMREVFDACLKSNPDVLSDAMLGRDFVNRAEAVWIIPAVGVGIRVATRPATQPVVRVATNVVVNSMTFAEAVSAETYAQAMYRTAATQGPPEEPKDKDEE